MKVISRSLAETRKAAKEFITTATGGRRRDSALVVALLGDLGAGKTAFVQQLAFELGVVESVTSPTFVIEKVYALPGGASFSRLIHIDAYRLTTKEELLHLGWDEISKDPGNIICIEWPSNVSGILQAGAVIIDCAFVDETTHTYSYEI